MSERIALVGASGHGKVIAELAKVNGFESIVFFDDRWPELLELAGIPVIGSVSDAQDNPEFYDFCYVSIGNSTVRSKVQKAMAKIGPPLIHPTASVSDSAELGLGTVVMPNAVINACSRVGQGVIVNSGAVIEHDCVVGDFSHICPNAAIAGGVTIGEKSWVGIGSTVIQVITIGTNVTVGAGSVVIRDVADKQTVVGNPAKILKR